MGSLKDLSNTSINVHMVITKSNMAEIFVYDTLKVACGATLDTILTVNTKSSFNSMMELVDIPSFLSDRWLFVIDYSRVAKLLKDSKGVLQSMNSCFLIKVSNYREYKEFKEVHAAVNDLYLSRIGFNDIVYLFRDANIPQKLIEFLSRSYGNEPDAIFTLLDYVSNGKKVETRKDIIALCGVSTGSISHFAMLLLKDLPMTEKGYNSTIKKRIAVGKELGTAYSYFTFKNFLQSSVKDILYIKELYNNGDIYDSLKDLPEKYDEKKLSRYSMYLDTIVTSIPYGRVLRLYKVLIDSERWGTEIDLLDFVYKYYGKG